MFSYAEKHLADKAQKAAFMLKRSIVSDWNNLITPGVALSLFDSYVKPVVLYGCEIWSLASYKNLKTGKNFCDPHTQNLVNVHESEKVMEDEDLSIDADTVFQSERKPPDPKTNKHKQAVSSLNADSET